MGRNTREYSDQYKESVYAIWVMNNRPSMGVLLDLIEPDEFGNTPTVLALANWKDVGGWETRADTLDIEIQQNTDRKLIEVRMEMMKRHAEKAFQIIEMAFEYLSTAGFDSSASAVSALKMAFDEEKKSRGVEIALTKVYQMSDEDLTKNLNNLLARSRGLEGVVDAEVEDAPSDN